jgi:hypothetical protein
MTPTTVTRPAHAVTRGACGAGVTPCGKPARFYAGGWRCDEHKPRIWWRTPGAIA